jgi:hypothetical protein
MSRNDDTKMMLAILDSGRRRGVAFSGFRRTRSRLTPVPPARPTPDSRCAWGQNDLNAILVETVLATVLLCFRAVPDGPRCSSQREPGMGFDTSFWRLRAREARRFAALPHDFTSCHTPLLLRERS